MGKRNIVIITILLILVTAGFYIWITNSSLKSFSNIDEYTEWKAQTDGLEMTMTYDFGGGIIKANINGKENIWTLSTTSINEHYTQVYMYPGLDNHDCKTCITGRGTLKGNSIIIDQMEKDERINNYEKLVFYKVEDCIPKLAVQALIREHMQQLFDIECLVNVSYEVLKDNENETSIKVTGILTGFEEEWEKIFVIKKNNKCYDVYDNNEKIYSYVPNSKSYDEVILLYLSEELDMNTTYAVLTCSYDSKIKMEKVHISNSYFPPAGSPDIPGVEKDSDGMIHYKEDFYVAVDSESGSYLVYDKSDNLVYTYNPEKSD